MHLEVLLIDGETIAYYKNIILPVFWMKERFIRLWINIKIIMT